MNWLAHVFLSPPDADFRLGILRADVVRGEDRLGTGRRFREGVACHLQIDAFTDFHPVVLRSKARVAPERRRFAGILMDLFYDHFLALHWSRLASSPLSEFTEEFYQQARETQLILPETAHHLMEHMIRHDRLGSYRKISGIESALQRMSQRWAARFPRLRAGLFADGVQDLRNHYAGLEADFLEFFPQLQAHVETQLIQF